MLVTKGETPLWRGDSFLNEGIPFLRGKNIKGEIDFDDIVYISEDVHERMKRSVLNEDFFLLTIAGTLGDVAFFKKEYPECNINQDIAKIKLTDEIFYEYAVVYFQTKFANSQIRILSNGATRGHLNFSQVRSFDVIVPPPDIQNHIIEIMQSARAQKKQRDQEADAVLDSIDDYVLAELGIEMPVVEEKKCFVVYANEAAGRRIDSHYYQSKFRVIDQIVTSAWFDAFNLGMLISNVSSGTTPKVEEDYYTDSSGIPFLRVQNVTSQRIDLSDAKFIKRKVHEGMLKRSQLKKDDLVFTITGRIGSVAVVPDNFEGNINQHSVRFHLKAQIGNININPHYVAVFLNSELGRSLAIREVTGGTRPALDYKALKALKVILPPIEVQNEIVTEVKQRLTKAQELRQEADAIMEEAKREAEQVLLEGASS